MIQKSRDSLRCSHFNIASVWQGLAAMTVILLSEADQITQRGMVVLEGNGGDRGASPLEGPLKAEADYIKSFFEIENGD